MKYLRLALMKRYLRSPILLYKVSTPGFALLQINVIMCLLFVHLKQPPESLWNEAKTAVLHYSFVPADRDTRSQCKINSFIQLQETIALFEFSNGL